MHPTLRVNELVLGICEHLHRDVADSKQSKATLAALSRTCKSISGIALSVLWRQQNGFVPLLGCLPSEVLSITKSSYRDRVRKTLSLQQSIRREHWSRAMYYSAFIQDLLLWEPENAFGNLDDQALESLATSLSDEQSPLLRNLRKVRYRARSVRKAAYPFLSIASGCNVDSILYTNDGVPFAAELSLIQTLAQKASMSIKEFSCIGLADKMTPHSSCYESIHAVLSSLPNLEFASIPCYGPLLEQLSNVPSLRALSVESRAFCTFPEPSPAGTPTKRHVHRFKSLNSLSLDFETGTGLIEFLEHCNFMESKLETLHIHLLHDCPTAIQRTLVDAFLPSIYTGALKDLSVFIRYSTQRTGVPMSELLDILVTSQQLETLEILLPEFLVPDLQCWEDGGDSLVAQIARRWGHLRQLTLASCVDGEGTVQGEVITLRSLAMLAHGCPELSFLRVTINASGEVPDLKAFLPSGKAETGHKKKIQLDFTSPSPISQGNVDSVAQFLGSVFQNIESLTVEETSDCKALWEEVEDILFESLAE